MPVPFVNYFAKLPLSGLRVSSLAADSCAARQSILCEKPSLKDFARLISPAASRHLEIMARKSLMVTRQRFGKIIRLFAPLYLSNECINKCSCCGFSRDNPILRTTLSVEEAVAEARELKLQGFRNILLVAGEHPKFISNGYVKECIHALHQFIPSISLELGPHDIPEYKPLMKSGAEGLVVYQETYDRNAYATYHTAGPKKNFDWRLETPERAYSAGFKRLGIGALFGLSDWRSEAIALAAHAQWLSKHCWKAQITVSIPRIRPCAGNFEPVDLISDRDLTQLICALRLFLPDVGIVLSTREPAAFRNGLIPLGISHMSAGSHTSPGGYTGVGSTGMSTPRKAFNTPEHAEDSDKRTEQATGQFDIADERTPHEVAEHISCLGYEPVWKDWDKALTS